MFLLTITLTFGAVMLNRYGVRAFSYSKCTKGCDYYYKRVISSHSNVAWVAVISRLMHSILRLERLDCSLQNHHSNLSVCFGTKIYTRYTKIITKCVSSGVILQITKICNSSIWICVPVFVCGWYIVRFIVVWWFVLPRLPGNMSGMWSTIN